MIVGGGQRKDLLNLLVYNYWDLFLNWKVFTLRCEIQFVHFKVNLSI